MAYTKTTWADGDVITADKLNNMEDGIANNSGGGGSGGSGKILWNLTNDYDNKMLQPGLTPIDFAGATVCWNSEDHPGYKNGLAVIACSLQNDQSDEDYPEYPSIDFDLSDGSKWFYSHVTGEVVINDL